MSKTHININVRRELWFAAHGRCEFRGCNKRLDVNGITMDKCNISNYAHIIGDSEDGPRGDSRSKELAKDPSNLMLLCPECHKLIDHEGVEKYSEELLRAMKKEHEDRIWMATAIQPENKSLVVAYGPKIGKDVPYFQKEELHNAIFPDRYPATLDPVEIQMKNSVLDEGDPDYWLIEKLQIDKLCADKVLKAIENGITAHVSLFPLGPQPLLVKLGTVLNDKYHVRVYQMHRIPRTWRWLDEDVKNDIRLEKPIVEGKNPVLVIALSAKAIKERIIRRLGEKASIWVITCDEPGNDMMRSKEQFHQFNRVARATMDAIKTAHPRADNLKIFMAAPASCAVELGRIRMPKADLPWVLFDYRAETDEDIEILTIK